MTERQGIEIDYCPTCRGVWLDRGELDKIIERSAAESGPARSVTTVHGAPPPSPSYVRDRDDDDDRRYRDPRYGKPYKKKSLLGELFDF
jgi:hypothetical protein